MSTAHIYSVFDDELKHLARRIAEMGGMVEQMVSDAIHALVTSDSALAQRVTFELVPGQRVVPEPMITLRPKNGIQMIVRRRVPQDRPARSIDR